MRYPSSTTRSVVFVLATTLMFLISCKKDFSLELPDPPEFEAVSADPVLLRYQFEVGQQWAMDFDLEMEIAVEAGSEELTITMEMEMDGLYVVQAVDPDGNATIETSFTRVTMEMSGLQDFRFDSENPSAGSREFQPLGGIIDVPFSGQISSVGEILNTDLSPLYDALGSLGDVGNFGQSTDQFLQSSFVQLPEEAVSSGNTYEAGSLQMMTQGIGNMEYEASYEVTSVSADQSQVLLRPMANIDFDFAELGFDLDLEETVLDGWLLFDAEKGNLTESIVGLSMTMSGQEGGEDISMQILMTMHYQSTEMEPVAVAAPETPVVEEPEVPVIDELTPPEVAEGTGVAETPEVPVAEGTGVELTPEGTGVAPVPEGTGAP